MARGKHRRAHYTQQIALEGAMARFCAIVCICASATHRDDDDDDTDGGGDDDADFDEGAPFDGMIVDNDKSELSFSEEEEEEEGGRE